MPSSEIRVTRGDLVNYAGVSGDGNPIHWDERFATGVAGSQAGVGALALFATRVGTVKEGSTFEAMSREVVSVIPPAMGPYMAPITAALSLPFTFFISNDAFYFGVVPILAEAGRIYGHTAEAIGRALPRRRRLSRHRFRKDPMTVSEEL